MGKVFTAVIAGNTAVLKPNKTILGIGKLFESCFAQHCCQVWFEKFKTRQLAFQNDFNH
jgi:hypothetical protein